MSTNPLVTVGVLSYNSASTILETLDSIASQTYHNIELIVSDDCSKDNTVEIAREWLTLHKSRFVRTELLTVDKNTGIASNANRIVCNAKGKFIKPIAADDILMPNCIEDNVVFVNKNPEVKILFSFIKCFSISNGRYIEKGLLPRECYLSSFNKSAKEQLIDLYIECFPPAPSFFIDCILAKENPYSDKYKNMEDYPQWIKLTQKGYKLHFMNKETVAYRIGESVSRAKKEQLYDIPHKETEYAFQDSIRAERLKYHPEIVRRQDFERKVFYFFTTHLKNKKNIFTLLIKNLLIRTHNFILKIYNYFTLYISTFNK